MDCEEMLLKQTEMTVAASPDTRVFVYRCGGSGAPTKCMPDGA